MNKTDSHSIFSTYVGVIEDSSCVANQEHAFGIANPHLAVVPNVYNKLICKWKCSSLAKNYSGGRMHHVAGRLTLTNKYRTKSKNELLSGYVF